MMNLQQSFPRLLYFYKRTLKGVVREIRPPYTVLCVALVDIETNKTVRLLENMLLRCVGFSWAKPSVTKSSTHLLVFIVLIPLAVLRAELPELSSLNSSERSERNCKPWR